jgi:hypothetical protein
MIRINSKELKEKAIGKYMATYAGDDVSGNSFASLSYAKIIDVVPETHLLSLECFGTNKAGERYVVYYRDDTYVDVYEEEEALLLVFRDFNKNDPENKPENKKNNGEYVTESEL